MSFETVWNGLSYAKRKALLKEAGYNQYHSGRVFQYLPKAVKEDCEFVYRRSQAVAA